MYTVKKGDTLSQLYGADWKNLSGYSGDPTKLQIGTQLNDLPNTLTTENIQPTSNVNIPPPPTDNTNYSGIVNSGNSQIPTPTPEDPFKVAKDYATSLIPPPSSADQYTDTFGQPISPEDYKAQQKQVADLTAQLASITAEGQVQNLQVENQGAAITSGGVSRSQTANNREIAIRALPIQAQLAAAQGNLTLATDKLNTLFKLKSDDATNLYNYNQKLIDKFYEVATQVQKDKLDQKRIDDQNKFTTMTNNLNYAQSLATAAFNNGQASIGSAIAKLDPNSPTYMADVAKLTGQIKAKADTSSILSSGGLKVSKENISQQQSALDASRGSDGYANTDTYLAMLAEWKSKKGLEQDFFNQFPPKNYLNPNEGVGSVMPQYIKDKLKVSSNDEPLFGPG